MSKRPAEVAAAMADESCFGLQTCVKDYIVELEQHVQQAQSEAYRKGAEDMRERAATVAQAAFALGRDASVSEGKIRALPIEELA